MAYLGWARETKSPYQPPPTPPPYVCIVHVVYLIHIALSIFVCKTLKGYYPPPLQKRFTEILTPLTGYPPREYPDWTNAW